MDITELLQARRAYIAEKARVCPMSTLPPSEDTRAYSFRGQLLSLSEVNLIPTLVRHTPDGETVTDNAYLEVAQAYVAAGAKALAVWTISDPFPGGSIEDLKLIRAEVALPILVLDLIVDPYQIYEAAHYGANAILLSPSWVNKDCLVDLVQMAHDLRLDVVLTAETAEELETILPLEARIIGLYGRTPLSSKDNLEQVKSLLPTVPETRLPVVLGGITDYWQVKKLRNLGAIAFLLDETSLKSEEISDKLRNLRGLFA